MNYKKLPIIFSGILAFYFSATIYAVNTSNIADTYHILPKKLQELSPLTGAVMWSKRVIERLYDHGHLTPDEPTDTTNSTMFNQKSGMWLEQIPSAGIKSIIRQLFNRPPGTEGQADFRPSKNLTDQPEVLVKKIACNLARIFVYQTLEKELDGKNSIQRKKKLAALLPLQTIGKVTNENFYQTYYDTVYPGVKIIEYALLSLLWVTAHNERQLLKLYFTTLKQELKISIKKIESNLAPKQSNKKKAKTPFPALGLLIPAEQVQALSSFSKALKPLETTVTEFDPEQFNVKNFYTPDDINKIQNKAIKTILQDDKLGEILIYAAITPRSRPPIIPLGPDLDFLVPNKERPVKALRACFEIAIQNLLNYYAFDPETQQYSVQKLESTLGRTVHPDLATFYQTHPEPKISDSLQARIDWAKILTDLDNIAYLKAADLQKENGPCIFVYESLKTSYQIRLTDTINEEIKKELALRSLNLPEKEYHTLYELQATFRNFILILDHLLQLNLFTEKNLGDELAQDNFVHSYLPIVLEALGAKTGYKAVFHSKWCKPSELHYDRGTLDFDLPSFQLSVRVSLDLGHGNLQLIHPHETGLKQLKELSLEEITQLPLILFVTEDWQYQEIIKQNGLPCVLSYFAHSSIKDSQEWALLNLTNLTDSWFKIIEYEEQKKGYQSSPYQQEKIFAQALKNKLPQTKEKSVTFIKKISAQPKCRHFPATLWTLLLAKDPKLSSLAFEHAATFIKNKTIMPFQKNDALKFLIEKSFIQTTSYKPEVTQTITATNILRNAQQNAHVVSILQQLLVQYADDLMTYNNIFFTIKEQVIKNEIPFEAVKQLFDLGFANATNNYAVSQMLHYMIQMVDTGVTPPQKAAPYIEKTNQFEDLEIYNKRLQLLETCLLHGLSIEQTTRYFQTITYERSTLHHTNRCYGNQGQFIKKYAKLAEKLLELDPKLTWSTKFWEHIDKHLYLFESDGLKAIKQKRTLAKQALLFSKNVLGACLNKPTIQRHHY